MTTVESRIEVFPHPRTCPYDPPAAYTEFRAKGGLHKVPLWDGGEAWLATRYADVKEALKERENLRSDVTLEGFPLPHPGSREVEAGLLVRLDGERHLRLRRILARDFSVKRVQAWRPRMAEIVDEVIDDLLAGPKPADLVSCYAHQVPARIVCEMLGFADRDRVRFADHVRLLIDLATPPIEAARAFDELSELIDRVIAAKRARPGDDVISRLVHEHLDPGDLDLFTVKQTLLMLFAAGQDSTAGMLGLSVLTLLQHPTERAKLESTSDAVPLAVEELLRFLSVLQGEPRRVATRDTVLGGCPVRRAEAVLPSLHAANFDPDVFDRDGSPAGVLDVRRGARNHLAFGYGAHQCLGQHLVRTELAEALPRLFERIPGLSLAVAPDALEYRTTASIYGLKRLPVTW